ncbi:Uncharacterised protein [Vibrio cholerae]|nr:Uncharacterised protein [Vibrio cholerae]CSI58339.1 Uncharacterised protein [Vibrio cholerae]
MKREGSDFDDLPLPLVFVHFQFNHGHHELLKQAARQFF